MLITLSSHKQKLETEVAEIKSTVRFPFLRMQRLVFSLSLGAGRKEWNDHKTETAPAIKYIEVNFNEYYLW